MLMAAHRIGWEPVEEGGKVIAMSGSDGAVSLRPAGQLELLGAPLDNIHRPALKPAASRPGQGDRRCVQGKGFLGLGMWPDKRRDELPIMPKGRYDIRLRHMPRVGPWAST
jgi:glutamate--cysteine ligase